MAYIPHSVPYIIVLGKNHSDKKAQERGGAGSMSITFILEAFYESISYAI